MVKRRAGRYIFRVFGFWTMFTDIFSKCMKLAKDSGNLGSEINIDDLVSEYDVFVERNLITPKCRCTEA